LELNGAEAVVNKPVPVDQTLAIMADTVGSAIDADCFASLQQVILQSPELFPK
jgi:hypothetical protein